MKNEIQWVKLFFQSNYFVQVHRYFVYKHDEEYFAREDIEWNSELHWVNICPDKVLLPNERTDLDFGRNNLIQKLLPDKEYCNVGDYRINQYRVSY